MQDWNKQLALKVYMHPGDLALLLPQDKVPAENVEKDLVRLGLNQVQWVPDASILLGGCVLRSAEGGLDARLQTQLEALRVVFLEARNARQLEMCTSDGSVFIATPRKRAGRRASDQGVVP